MYVCYVVILGGVLRNRTQKLFTYSGRGDGGGGVKIEEAIRDDVEDEEEER